MVTMILLLISFLMISLGETNSFSASSLTVNGQRTFSVLYLGGSGTGSATGAGAGLATGAGAGLATGTGADLATGAGAGLATGAGADLAAGVGTDLAADSDLVVLAGFAVV